MSYRRDEVTAPRVAGVALKAFIRALESGLGSVLLKKITTDSGLDRWRRTPTTAPPLVLPLPIGTGGPATGTSKSATSDQPTSRLETAAAFRAAWKQGRDPSAVIRSVETAIERLDGRDERLGLFIARKKDEVFAAAETSSARLRAGKPLSSLDGIPVMVKDEIDIEGFATTQGTRFFNDIAPRDASVVARLKSAGMIILGKGNMNEIGINPIGLNPWHGATRNPWDRHRMAGGSSSASGSAVAAGIAPLSLGADGGGSIRIPAALCGIVGLKATWGRIPETGIPPLCWTVGHVGPMGICVDDVAELYRIIAGPDGQDVIAAQQPPVEINGLDDLRFPGLRVGVCWKYFEDAEPDVVARCREAVQHLVAAGATVVELPPPDLNTVLWTHSALILTEMCEAMREQLDEDPTVFGLDSRANLAIGRYFTGTDYVHALRHRTGMIREWQTHFTRCDVYVTPTTAMTAPPIAEETLPDGESNLPVVDALMRFIRVGNLTGFPAISVNAGFDRAGLPVGVHFMGRPWEESLLLRVAKAVERNVEVRFPKEHAFVLGNGV